MNSSEIISTLTDRLNKSQKEIKTIFVSTLDTLKNHLAEHDNFRIPGFGTFDVAERKHRKSYNPHSKKMMLLPKKVVAVFRPSKALKEKMK